jgi:hypothetical protein
MTLAGSFEIALTLALIAAYPAGAFMVDDSRITGPFLLRSSALSNAGSIASPGWTRKPSRSGRVGAFDGRLRRPLHPQPLRPVAAAGLSTAQPVALGPVAEHFLLQRGATF